MTTAHATPIDEQLAAFMRGEQALVADPYPLYRRLREEAPVHAFGGMAVLSTHAEVKGAYRDAATFVNWRPGPDQERTADALDLLSDDDLEAYRAIHRFELNYMSSKNGEDHRRVRDAAQRAFAPRRLAELAERTRRIAEEALDEVVGAGVVDITPIAHRIPLLVIGDMLGAPREDAAQLKAWGDDVNAHKSRRPLEPDDVRRSARGIEEFRAYVAELVARSRADGNRSGLVGALLDDVDTGAGLTEDEVVAQIVLFLFAGHETTGNLINNGLLALLRHPAEWERLRAERGLVPTAVEEFLRFEPPAQASPRLAARDVEVLGTTIAANTPVLLMIAAANRDPAAFPDPDALDVGRRPNDHMSFIHGRHFCIGAPLARLEGRVVFETLLERVGDLRPGADPAAVTWRREPILRGVSALPLELVAA